MNARCFAAVNPDAQIPPAGMSGGFVDSLPGFGLNAHGTINVLTARRFNERAKDGCGKAVTRIADRVGEEYKCWTSFSSW